MKWAYLAAERVEPYCDDRIRGGHWRKIFRRNGPLEWFNGPSGDSGIVDVGCVFANAIREALDLLNDVPGVDGIDPDDMLGEYWSQHIANVMGDLAAVAPNAMSELVAHRVPGTPELAAHPYCQVGPPPRHEVGLLGVLNALATAGRYRVAAVVELDGGAVSGFKVVDMGGS